MKRSDRQKVFEKFGGRCAYTGKPLDDKWQVDHIIPRSSYIWWQDDESRLRLGITAKSYDDIENLVPALRIVNHYKRAKDLEDFRKYMRSFHLRLAKLPKNTRVHRTGNRKRYMMEVAEMFGITPEKPFCGKFFFETIDESSSNR